MVIERVSSRIGVVRQLREAMLGENVHDVYKELTGGVTTQALRGGEAGYMYGSLVLPGFQDRGLLASVLVNRGNASLAVLEMDDSRIPETVGDLVNHPRAIAGVETGYFNADGQPEDDEKAVARLAIIKSYVGSSGSWKSALHEDVTGRILASLRGINPNWIIK